MWEIKTGTNNENPGDTESLLNRMQLEPIITTHDTTVWKLRFKATTAQQGFTGIYWGHEEERTCMYMLHDDTCQWPAQDL